jgi:hypothetical protein
MENKKEIKTYELTIYNLTIRISKKTMFENGKTYDIAVLCLKKK